MLTKIARRLIEHNSSPPVEELRKAAVLLALSDSENPELLYTLRSSKVSSHGGEVSFPGGMYELEDKSLEHTALRESFEETGLESKDVKILGTLDTTVSRFNVSVTPYVGIVPVDTALNSDSDEIDACFKVPLSFFLEDKRFRNDLIERGDESFFMPAYKYDSFIIWGLTAMITVNFLNLTLDAGIDLQSKGKG
jgi:8-oxo-dGTP pyrophosphatase MutT (NUDIX family)|tara:strand:- start:1456 stop:2037 length:582 start_codon:yes stop_codon:yes gene_type:complete